MLITHGTLVTMGQPNEIIPDGALYIENERIAGLGPSAELEARYPDTERLDASGQLVMPGLICAHTHFYGAFARGMALSGDPPANFPEILEKLWWRLDKALWPDDVHYSALTPTRYHHALRSPRQSTPHRRQPRPDCCSGGPGRRAGLPLLRSD
jgi:cytosine/adenosine deaminase-related metal-dependent hydrolase